MTRAVAFLLLIALAACRLDMVQQPRMDTYARTTVWRDQTTARPLPMGVVARGDLEQEAAVANPPPVTPALLARGQERFTIYCAPCHGLGGEGDGMIVQRGFPRPPSYHTQRLRAAPAQHFVDVITKGYGVMYAYADRVDPADRWAITAYIRALQLSHYATFAEAPEAREHLP